MAKNIIRIDQENNQVTFPEIIIQDDLVIKLFDQTPKDNRNKMYEDVIRVGSYAYLEDRIGTFLKNSSSKIGADLEYLKLLYDKKKDALVTTQKGAVAEDDLIKILQNESNSKNYKDIIESTALKTGALGEGSNKTGDIIIRVAGNDGPRIVIESKINKSISVGSLTDPKHENKHADTAWSQLVEGTLNRDAQMALIIFDESAASPDVRKQVNKVLWVQGAGIAVMVNFEKSDFTALLAVYSIVRSYLLATQHHPELDIDRLKCVVSHALTEVQRIAKINTHVDKINEAATAIKQDLLQSKTALENIINVLEKYTTSNKAISPQVVLELQQGENVRMALKNSPK